MSTMWAVLHLDQDGDQSQRVLRNMDIKSIQKVFTTPLNKFQSLHKEELFGLHGQVDWDDSPWKSCTLLDQSIYRHLQEKFLHGFCSCLGGQCPEQPRSGNLWGREHFVFSSRVKSILNFMTSLESWSCSSGSFTRVHYDTASPRGQEDDQIKVHPQDFKDPIIFMSKYNDIDWTHKNNIDVCQHNSPHVSANATDCPAKSWTFIGLEMRKSGM